jgi:phosphate transport system permease protein
MVNPMEQFMNLAYHIFIMSTQSTNVQLTRPIQYGTALVLLVLTFLLNLTGIILRARVRRQHSRGK